MSENSVGSHNPELELLGRDIKEDINNISAITNTHLRHKQTEVMANEVGSEGISRLVDAVIDGADDWIGTKIIDQVAKPGNLVDIARLLSTDQVVSTVDRSSRANLIEKAKDLLPNLTDSDRLPFILTLKGTLIELIDMRNQLIESANYAEARVYSLDIQSTVDMLKSVGKNEGDDLDSIMARQLDIPEDVLPDIKESEAGRFNIITSLFNENRYSEAIESINDIDSEKWSKNVSRLIRRSAIERYITKGDSLEVIKRKVRQFELEFGSNDVVEALTMEEIVINPKMEQVAQELSQEVIKRFPGVTAIVLLGSSVHGGAQIRSLTQSNSNSDFDWGIIYNQKEDGSHDEADSMPLINFVNDYLGSNSDRLGLGLGFSSCETMNPSENKAPNLADDVEEALSLMDEDIVLYFQPSYPASVNIENRAKIKDKLVKLSQVDPQGFSQVAAFIIKEWKEIHDLKEKHFNIANNQIDRNLLKGVIGNSFEFMATPLEQYFERIKLEGRNVSSDKVETDNTTEDLIK